jgi:hypothetical protein
MHSVPTSAVQYRPMTFDCTVRWQHDAEGSVRAARRAVPRSHALRPLPHTRILLLVAFWNLVANKMPERFGDVYLFGGSASHEVTCGIRL